MRIGTELNSLQRLHAHFSPSHLPERSDKSVTPSQVCYNLNVLKLLGALQYRCHLASLLATCTGQFADGNH